LIWKFKSQSQKCVNNIFPSSFSHLIIFIETIINFLEGLDFYYLSNEAYFFIIPACIRYGIEKFENNEDLEYLLFFLSDRDRVKYANDKIKKLVVSYLELLKKLKFLVFGREEEKCLEIWR